MGRICVVDSCKREYYPDCGLSFHRFPKDPNVREIWINIIPISSNRKLTNASVVCSKHFKAQDFVVCLSRPVLKCDAVPSVCLLPATKKIGVLCDIQISCTTKSNELVLSLEPPSKKHCIQQEFINVTAEPLAEKSYQVLPKSNLEFKDASVQTEKTYLQRELLKQKVKIMMRKLRRRVLKIQYLLDIIKRNRSNCKKINLKLKDASVQTEKTYLQRELLKQKVKIMMRKLRRRVLKIQYLLNIIKRNRSNCQKIRIQKR